MKKLLIGFSVTLVLILAALLVAPSFIDWTSYRAEIMQKVKEETGRDVVIGGDIIFSVLPSPVLKVGDIRLSNMENAEHADMVSIRQLDVAVSFMPLLAGNLHISSIRLIEPVIYLEKNEKGVVNWEFSKPGDVDPQIEVENQAGNPAFIEEGANQDTPLPLQIDDFIVENGHIVFEDKTIALKEQISELNSRFSLAGLNGPFEAAGTLKARGIPIGFEGTVGKIVHGRTATFSSEIKLAHGATTTRISGSFINLPEGPRLSTKLDINGKSLAGLISALDMESELPGGLDQPFSVKGDVGYSRNVLSLGDGLDLVLGQDRGTLVLDFDQNSATPTLRTSATFNKIDADAWVSAKAYKPVVPSPLPLVIQPSKSLMKTSGAKISTSLSFESSPKAAKSAETAAKKPVSLPKDINVEADVSVNALLIKGEPIRQIQARAVLNDGELVLENVSAILPGAGEVFLAGVAAEREGQLIFDGSMEAQVSHLRGALNWAGVEVNGVPSDRLQQVRVNSKIQATADNVQLYDFVTKMDGSTLAGGATIALRSRPSFGVNVTLDRLNVDAYSAAPAGTTPSTATTQATGTSNAKASSDTSMIAPIVKAFESLKSFDANVAFGVDHLTYMNRDIRQINLDALIYNGELTLRDLSVGSFAGVGVAAQGAVKKQDSAILAENLSVSVKAKSLQQVAPILNIEQVADWKKVGPIALTAALNGNILAPDVDLSLDTMGASLIVAASTDLFPVLKADASVNARVADLGKVMSGLKIDYQPAGKAGPIELNSDIAWTASKTAIKNLTGSVNKTPISGTGQFVQGARPHLTLQLQTGDLRLDPFMPKASQPTAANNNRGSAQAPSGQTQERWSKDKIDVSALKSMDANVDLSLSSVSYKKTTMGDLTVNAVLKDGILTASQSVGRLFGGRLKSSATVNAQNILSASLKTDAQGLQIAPLMAMSGGKAKASGVVNFSSDVSMTGQTEYDLISSLSGKTQLQTQKLALSKTGKGASALDVLNLLGALSGADPSKGLADVSVTADMANGVATLSEANLVSPIARGSATGNVDIANWLIDVSGNLNVQQNALIGLLAQKAKMKSSYPFSFKGTLDKPDIKFDTGGVSSGGGLVIPLPDKLEKKGYGNLIRGLLGQKQQPQQPQAPVQPVAPKQDGTIAPPPPPPGQGSSSGNKLSKEELIFQGIGKLLGQ